MALDSKIPQGHISEKWTNHKNNLKLVAPNNRPKIDVIVVGTGLAGASAAASFGIIANKNATTTENALPKDLIAGVNLPLTPKD